MPWSSRAIRGLKPHHASGMRAHPRNRSDFLALQAMASRFDQIGHQRIHQPLERFIEVKLFVRCRILPLHRAKEPVKQRQAFADDAARSRVWTSYPSSRSAAVVSNLVRDIDQLGFERWPLVQAVFAEFRKLVGRVIARVLDDAFPNFEGQIEAGEVGIFLLEGSPRCASACRLWSKPSSCFCIMLSSAPSPDMAKGRVAHVMHQRQRFHQVGVQAQRLRHGAADLRHFQRVRQAIAEMVGIAPGENLCLVFQAAEGAGVEDAVAIALVFIAIGMRRLGKTPALRLSHCHGVARQASSMVATHDLASTVQPVRIGLYHSPASLIRAAAM